MGGTIIYLEPLIKLDGAFDYFETEDQVRDKHVLVHNYVLPRQDTIIVGGTSEAENAPHDPDLATHLVCMNNYNTNIIDINPIYSLMKHLEYMMKD